MVEAIQPAVFVTAALDDWYSQIPIFLAALSAVLFKDFSTWLSPVLFCTTSVIILGDFCNYVHDFSNSWPRGSLFLTLAQPPAPTVISQIKTPELRATLPLQRLRRVWASKVPSQSLPASGNPVITVEICYKLHGPPQKKMLEGTALDIIASAPFTTSLQQWLFPYPHLPLLQPRFSSYRNPENVYPVGNCISLNLPK